MAEEQKEKNGKKKRAFLIVGTIVVLGVIIGYFYAGYRKTHVSTDDAFIQGNIHTVSARISGHVKNILVADNQHVKKGDVLVELDPVDYQSRAEAARAHVALQQATLHQAERDLKRAKSLYEQNANSAERYDKALSTREIAAAQLKVENEKLVQAELNLGYTTIVAPADGFVTRKSVEIGNQVSVGQPLMAIVDLDNIYVIGNYKETQLERIRPGQDVRITVDSFPGKIFEGTVNSIMAGTGVTFSLFPPENATGNYVKVVQRIPVKILLKPGQDKDHRLRIGMSAEPTVIAR